MKPKISNRQKELKFIEKNIRKKGIKIEKIAQAAQLKAELQAKQRLTAEFLNKIDIKVLQLICDKLEPKEKIRFLLTNKKLCDNYKSGLISFESSTAYSSYKLEKLMKFNEFCPNINIIVTTDYEENEFYDQLEEFVEYCNDYPNIRELKIYFLMTDMRKNKLMGNLKYIESFILFQGNIIGDELYFINNMKNLKKFGLRNAFRIFCGMFDLSGIYDNENITYLDLSSNYCCRLNGIERLPNLKTLKLCENFHYKSQSKIILSVKSLEEIVIDMHDSLDNMEHFEEIFNLMPNIKILINVYERAVYITKETFEITKNPNQKDQLGIVNFFLS